jgi:monomeric sarcosine oxidase
MASYDLIVVGSGVMGASCACEAALAGANVALVDQTQIPNPRAASIDHSKVFRFAYDDPLYVRLAVEALKLWQQLEAETSRKLLTQTGMLLIGNQTPSFESRTFETMNDFGLEVELLSSTDVHHRFPQFADEAIQYAVFDPAGGILHAELAVMAFLDLARRRGVRLQDFSRIVNIEGSNNQCVLTTESADKLSCGAVVIATGPWSRNLLPEVSSMLHTTRQEVFYFDAPAQEFRSRHVSFEPPDFPVFSALEEGFYGLPVHNRGAMKIANHNKGEYIDPNIFDDSISEKGVSDCREFFSKYIPALSSASLAETRVCVYNNTPDDDFIIDWHPSIENTLIVTGFSGHGFKFGSVIGKIASDLILSKQADFEIDRFKLKRLQRHEDRESDTTE